MILPFYVTKYITHIPRYTENRIESDLDSFLCIFLSYLNVFSNVLIHTIGSVRSRENGFWAKKRRREEGQREEEDMMSGLFVSGLFVGFICRVYLSGLFVLQNRVAPKQKKKPVYLFHVPIPSRFFLFSLFFCMVYTQCCSIRGYWQFSEF